MIFQKPAKNYIRFAVEWENFTSKLLVKLVFLLRTSEAEFFTSLIFKRFLSNIWSWARENWSESLRTDSVAVRVK